MKKKILFYSFFIFLILLLQTTLLHYAELFGVIPNILIVFVISTALLRGSLEGSVVGFFSGLFIDMLFGGALGFYALLGFYLGIAAGSVNRRLFRENLLVVVFFTFVYSVAYESIVYIVNNIMTGNMKYLYAFTSVMLPEAIYNCAVAVVLHPLLIKADRWIESDGKMTRNY